MSILYVTVADSRVFNQSHSIRDKVLTHLATKWEETQYSVDTPFIDSISRYFSTKNMSQTSRESSSTTKEKKPVIPKCPMPELVDVLTLICELQKQQLKKHHLNSKSGSTPSFSFDIESIEKFQLTVEKKWGIQSISAKEPKNKADTGKSELHLRAEGEEEQAVEKENPGTKASSKNKTKLFFNIPANMEKLHSGQKMGFKDPVQRTTSPKKVRGDRAEQGIASELQNEIEM